MGSVADGMGPNNRVMVADGRLQAACEALREYADSDTGSGGVIHTVSCDGIEVGYRVEAKMFKTFIRREVFVKTPGQDIGELKGDDLQRVMTAVFNVFVLPGQAIPDVTQIAYDCIRLRQDVIPLILTERAPRLVSIAGGFGGAKGNA